MKRVILIGYMGSGKTTLGKILAQHTGLHFIDLDWHIEKRYHKTVSELFAEQGEEEFRTIEQRMLHEVSEFENVIISSGGGTPCFFDNMEYMNRQALTVYLKASPKVLFHHLKMGKQQRPLLKGKSDEELLKFIQDTLQKREQYYSKAHIIFNTDKLDSTQLINTASQKLLEAINDAS